MEFWIWIYICFFYCVLCELNLHKIRFYVSYVERVGGYLNTSSCSRTQIYTYTLSYYHSRPNLANVALTSNQLPSIWQYLVLLRLLRYPSSFHFLFVCSLFFMQWKFYLLLSSSQLQSSYAPSFDAYLFCGIIFIKRIIGASQLYPVSCFYVFKWICLLLVRSVPFGFHFGILFWHCSCPTNLFHQIHMYIHTHSTCGLCFCTVFRISEYYFKFKLH